MTNRVRILLDHTPFPGAGEDFGGHKVIESVMDVSGRNWEIHLKGSLSKSQVKSAVSELTAAPFALPVEDDYSLVEFRAKGMTHVRTNPPGNATVVRGHMYYARPNPITPSQFQVEMDEMLIDNPEEHFVKHSAPTDAALKKKLWSFVTYTGESYGWYKGGDVYHRRASIIMPKIKINKALEGATMFYHTHPAKDEPSLTSADDIQFYLDLHFAWGIKTFYTVMKHKMDKFTIKAKPGGKEKYLRMEEEAFVDAVDALIGKGEERAEKEVKKEAPETDYQNAVTAEMVRQFNKKYSSIAEISFRPSVKKASAAAAAAKESPRYLWGARSNPGPNPPIKPEQKYMASALNELKGLDYAYEHYGGDEYAHTMYVYWWMRHHFMPTPQHKAGRLYKLQPFGLDSEARGQLRSYLSTTIAGSWTYLDAMFIIGLYHDIAKLREKSDSRHHSTIGAEMFLQEIQAELNLPSQVAEDIAHVLSTDVGRRGIDDETFRAQVGDYYGVAKLMQMADVYTHHPFMFTNSARAAKESGAIEYSDGQMYKDYAMTELVDDVKDFLDAYARPNPPPVPVFVKWRGSYNRGNFDMDIVEATLEDFDQRNVPDQDGKTGSKQGGSGGHLFYMRFNQTHVSSIPEGTVVKASLALRTGVLLVDVSSPPADAGLQYAQEIYELVGTELQASFPDVEVEVVEPEPMVNPRKAARIQLITLSGPSGSGKSTVLRHLLKSIPDAAAPPTYTTRPRRPTDGNDRRFMTKTEFMNGIKRGDFAEWYQAGSGHFYGRKLEDFLGSYAIVDVSFRGMEYYRKLFPNTHTVFLAPDPKISVKERAKKLYKRGGISKEEAMRRAKVGRQMAIDAKKYNFDVTVQMKDGEYTKGANEVLESIPRDNPARSVPWREITEEDAARVAAVRQAEYLREGQSWNEKTRRLIDSTNWMAIEGTHNDFNNYPRAHKAPSWYNTVQDDDRKYGVVMKKPGKTLFDFNPIVEVPPVLGGDEENAPTVNDEPLNNPPISELMSDADRYYVDQVKEMVELVSPLYMDSEGRIMGVFEVPVVAKRDDGKIGRIGTNRLLFYTRTGEGTPEVKAQEILDDPGTSNYDLIAESPSFSHHGLGDGDWDSLGWSCMIGVNRGKGWGAPKKWYIKPKVETFSATIPKFEAPASTWEEKFSRRFGHRTMYYASLAIRELYPDKDKLVPISLNVMDLYGRYNLRGFNRNEGIAINCFLHEFGAVRSKYAILSESHLPRSNPSKELFDWFTEWVHLINMKNKELKAFLDSPLGKKAGLSKEEADAQGIKSGRVSGRRILKMRAKLGLAGPKDYIKIGPRIIESYYEKALKEWTGPSDDALDGETDWDWCKRQVRFVKRHGAFPYNANQKGPLVRKQKTQNQVSRRLLGLWVWGHDPWRWARKHGVAKMPKCPDVPWIGMTEKRKYGKVEVKMNPHYTPPPGISMFPGELHQGPAALYQQTVSITQLTNPPADSLAEDWAYEQPNPRIPKKYEGQDPSEHSDLYTDEEPTNTIQGLGFKDKETAERSINIIKRSGKTHAHKIQAAMAMEQRARFHPNATPGIQAAQRVYAEFIEEMKEKTKRNPRTFSGIREAHEHYNYPGSHRTGTVIEDGLVVRSYSNNTGHDEVAPDGSTIEYMLKEDRIRAAFQNTKEAGKTLRFFLKTGTNEVTDMGEYSVEEVGTTTVRLSKETIENPRTPGGKKVPTRYLKGLTKLERMIAEDEIDKGYEYDTDDPEAYKFWKSDIKATARGLKIGPSKHKEEYYRRYRKNIDPDYKPSGSTPKRKFVNRITKETGIKRSLIEKVYSKGLAAWRTGHRPGVQQHQWAAGRVYAFVVGADSSTGPGKPDHTLAVEAGVR